VVLPAEPQKGVGLTRQNLTIYIVRATMYQETVALIFWMATMKPEGGELMKVEVQLDEKCAETTVTIVAKEMTDEVNALLHQLSNQYPNVITGFRDGNAVILDIKKIVRAFAAKQKVYVVAEDGQYTVRLRLYQLEERLSREFVRISNAEIINLQKVRDFDLSFAGSICVRFINGDTAFASRRYVSKIKNLLGL
jgi:DNA-binding LytR/AlgR family response regulator